MSAVPVRGVSLTERLYPDLSWRAIADIDLLIDPGDVRAAYDALKQLGMADAENPWNTEALDRLARRSALHDPELRLVSAQGGSVELHWDWVEPALPTDDLCSAPEAYLVYLCRHAGNHFWWDLRWLTDIELFLREFGANLDWDLVWRLGRANGAAGLAPPLFSFAQASLAVNCTSSSSDTATPPVGAWPVALSNG